MSGPRDALSYVADIRPLFRPQDIACMTRGQVLLDDLAWMTEPVSGFGYERHGNANVVGERLAAKTMPPDGAWSDELIALYLRWVEEGCRP